MYNLENGALAPGTAPFFPVFGLDDRCIRVDLGHVGVGVSLLEAGLAVDLLVAAFLGIVDCGIEWRAALDTTVAFTMPRKALGGNSLRFKDLQMWCKKHDFIPANWIKSGKKI
jgi:hypothetical protein